MYNQSLFLYFSLFFFIFFFENKKAFEKILSFRISFCVLMNFNSNIPVCKSTSIHNIQVYSVSLLSYISLSDSAVVYCFTFLTEMLFILNTDKITFREMYSNHADLQGIIKYLLIQQLFVYVIDLNMVRC